MAIETFVSFSNSITEHPRSETHAFEEASVYIRNNIRKVPDLNMFESHAHEHYEIICFLSGDVEYYIEGNVYSLKPGDILILKKAEVHTLLIKADTPYERIVIQFVSNSIAGPSSEELLHFLNDRPIGKHNHYPAAKFNNPHWIWLLKQMCTLENHAGKKTYLTTLLWQLYYAYPNICQEDENQKSSVADVIQYINNHLAEDLSVPMLCQKFFVSKAQLNRKFKKTIGSPVWDYIVTKRLHLARDLLLEGVTPSKACIKSGFNDYSSFYRAYKTRFGVSPGNTI